MVDTRGIKQHKCCHHFELNWALPETYPGLVFGVNDTGLCLLMALLHVLQFQQDEGGNALQYSCPRVTEQGNTPLLNTTFSCYSLAGTHL